MLEYVLLALVGCGFGVITGLTPGLHINTVCLIGLGFYAGFGLDALDFGVFAVAMSVTHAFLDFIPSIFLGVPEESTALSVLPTHRLVMAGHGFEAVKLTAYGCLLGLVFGLLFLLPVLYFVPVIYRQIRGVVVYAIASAECALILREDGWGRLWAFVVFSLSGILGLLTLDCASLSSSQVLFPVFAGLFGLSGIVCSLGERQHCVPQQGYANVRVDGEVVRGGFFGAAGGVIVGLLPAMSPSQVGILMSEAFGSGQRGFLVSVAAISTSDSIYSLVSLYTIQNARSGVAVMLGRILEFDASVLALFVGVFCLSALAAFFLHLEIGRRAMVLFGRVDYRVISSSVLVFVLFLVWFFTGTFGVLVAMVAAAVGVLPIRSGVSRTHLMGVLLLPTIFYFLGVGI
jgi:putative membrane protein